MFCRHLYMDEYVSEHFQTIRAKCREQKYPSGIFAIVLSKNSGRVEYFDMKELKQKYYKETGNLPFIIGMAKGADSAMNLVGCLLNETYASRGDVNVLAYLKEKSLLVQTDAESPCKITVYSEKGEKAWE